MNMKKKDKKERYLNGRTEFYLTDSDGVKHMVGLRICFAPMAGNIIIRQAISVRLDNGEKKELTVTPFNPDAKFVGVGLHPSGDKKEE